MAQYDNIKSFCNRVIHLQKSNSKELRLTQEEAVSLMCELNQLLLTQKNTIQIPNTESKIQSSVDAGSFQEKQDEETKATTINGHDAIFDGTLQTNRINTR